MNQIQYICKVQKATPQKRGRPSFKLSDADIDKAIQFIRTDKITRRMTYRQLIDELDLQVCTQTLKAALERRGYSRHRAQKKPVLNETRKKLRL